jgi:hypothetical protein
LIFVTQNDVALQKAEKRYHQKPNATKPVATCSSSAGKLTNLIKTPTYPSLSPTLDHVTSLVVQSFAPDEELALFFSSDNVTQSQICGAWVEVLPMFVGGGVQDSALDLALKALAVSILARGPNPKASVLDGINAYVSALRPLQKAIQKAGNSFRGDLAAAIMCLLFAEVSF